MQKETAATGLSDEQANDLTLHRVNHSFFCTGGIKVAIKHNKKRVEKTPAPTPNETELLLQQIRKLSTNLNYLGEKMKTDQLVELMDHNWNQKETNPDEL